MKKLMAIFSIVALTGAIFVSCGKESDGKSSAKAKLDELQPANVNDSVLLADAVGSAIGFSQSGVSLYAYLGMMSAMKSLRISVLRGSKIGILQVNEFNCSGTQDHFTCTQQCEYGGTNTLECSVSQDSGICTATANDCQEYIDEPPSNGNIKIEWSTGANGNGSMKVSMDVTMGDGFIYGSYEITFTPSGTGGTLKLTLDISGADYNDPTDIGYIYFDETVNMKDIGTYGFEATINGNGAFGTTKKGKVNIAINNVVVNPSQCRMEPVSGTVTVSAGDSSVKVTFDGGSGGGTPPVGCDGKATCSGAFNGTIDITEASEPIIDF